MRKQYYHAIHGLNQAWPTQLYKFQIASFDITWLEGLLC